jgi:hypothetical protein
MLSFVDHSEQANQTAFPLPEGKAKPNPSQKLQPGFRIVVWMLCALLGAVIGAYVFNGNSDSRAAKLPWALAVGLASAALAGVSLWWAFGSFLSFCHLVSDHRRAFWRGTWTGAAGGMLLGFLVWHSVIPFQGPLRTAVWSAALLWTTGGLLLGCARARSEHHPEQGAPSLCPAARRAGPLLAALLLTAIAVPIPTDVIGTDSEQSWRAVLDYAHRHELQFGTDLVWTYGPLGFLTIPDFSPHLAGLRMMTSLILSFVVSLGVSLVAWRLAFLWRCLLLVTFVAWSFPTPLGTDVMLQTGLLCWGILCLAESGPGLWIYALTLVLLAVFATMTKLSSLPAAGLCLAVIACDFAVRGRRALGMSIVLGFAAGVLILWIALDQSLSRLPAFLARAWTISRDYDLDMGNKPNAGVLWRGVLTVLCASAIVIFRSLTAFANGGTVSQWRRGLLLLWSCALLFLIWKHGFVNVDLWHVSAFLAVVPMLALAFGALPAKNPAAGRWGRAMALACCCYVFANPVIGLVSHLDFLSLGSLRLGAQHVHRLLRPTEYWRQMSQEEQVALRRAELPRFRRMIGAATVDVFGYNQSFALYNRLNYRPRPVFQSGVAHSPPLMRLNERFYLSSAAAPDYVLFRLTTEYSKFPPLEDALVLRLLLQNYEPVEAEGPFLLLKFKSSAPSRLTLLRAGAARLGEPIELKDFGDLDTWLEIRLEPTLLGRIRQFLYKPSQVWLQVECDRSEARQDRFWAPARMLEAGFLASPLVLDNLDVLHLYTGQAIVRPRAYSVEADLAGLFYRSPFHFRIYKIENRLGRCAPPGLGTRLTPTVKRQVLLLPDGILCSR